MLDAGVGHKAQLPSTEGESPGPSIQRAVPVSVAVWGYGRYRWTPCVDTKSSRSVSRGADLSGTKTAHVHTRLVWKKKKTVAKFFYRFLSFSFFFHFFRAFMIYLQNRGGWSSLVYSPSIFLFRRLQPPLLVSLMHEMHRHWFLCFAESHITWSCGYVHMFTVIHTVQSVCSDVRLQSIGVSGGPPPPPRLTVVA